MNGIEVRSENNPSSRKDFLVDTELIPLAEKAEQGCIDSQIELYEAFSYGKRAKKNLEAAKYYLELSLETIEDDDVLNTLLKLASIWNLALLEHKQGNYAAMKEGFHEVVEYMQEKIPFEKWDFSLFSIMEEYLEDRD